MNFRSAFKHPLVPIGQTLPDVCAGLSLLVDQHLISRSTIVLLGKSSFGCTF